MRRRLLGLCVLGLVVAGLLGAGVLMIDRARGTDGSQQSYLAALVSQTLSSQARQVHIGGVDGALSSDATIHDVIIADRDGPWLRLDRARLKWNRAALFLRRLEIDDLEIGHLEILRRPLPSEKSTDLTNLPVKIEIRRFVLGDLDLGAPLLGTAVRVAATGDTVLGSPSAGLVLDLDGKRLDRPGTLSAALTYKPEDHALKVKVALDEPPGGLIAQVAHLEGAPPASFRLAGDGTLDAFAARLDFHAGPKIDAAGSVILQRRDAGRDLKVRVGGHLGGLLPSTVAPVFAGATDLSSDARIDDAGSFALDDLSLASHLARLDAHGTLSADKVTDFAAAVRAVPNDGDVSALDGAAIRKLVLDASVQGPLATPRVRAGLALADARLPQGSVAKLDASFTATPTGAITDAATRVALEGSAVAEGVAPRDAGLARAIGGSANLTLRGSLDREGLVTFDMLQARTPTLTVGYAGDVGHRRLHGRLMGRAPDLSRFGEVAGRRLAGSASLGVDVDGVPADHTIHAALAAALRDVSTGVAAVDGLAGTTVDAKGVVSLAEDRWTVDGLTLEGAHLSARVAGTVAPEDARLEAHVALADLAKADPRLTGAAALDARLTGGLARPDVSLTASVDGASAMGRPIPHLGLVADVSDPRGGATAHVVLDGSVDRKPVAGRIALARRGGGWDLSSLDVTIGSVVLKGSGSVDSHRLAQGNLGLVAGDLDDLSPLVLTKLGGALTLQATLAAPDGRQQVTLLGHGADLRAGPATIHGISLRAAATDLYGHPVVDADARLDSALVGGQQIAAASLTAKGDPAQSAIKLTARAAGFDLDAAGALVPGPSIRFDLASFSARRGARKIALAGPADFAFADGGVAIEHLALGIAGGRLAIAGHAGKTLDLAVDARAIPLAAADIVKPGLSLAGTLDAGARIGGTPADPTGPYHLSIKRLAVPQAKEAGVPPIDVAASGALADRRARVEAKISAGRAGTITATGSLPLDPAAAIDLAVRGKLDAAVANARLAPDGRSVSGSILVDARLAGTRAAPQASGTATMTGGTFRDALLGVRLEAIDARLTAKGDHVAIERLSAATPAGGTLSGSGDVRLDPGAGFPGHVALHGRDAQLVASSLMTATANLDMDVTGALARDPRVTGRVELKRADVGIPDRLPSSIKPIDGIVHVNAPPNVAARLAATRRTQRVAKGLKSRPTLFDAALDITIAAPNGIFVRGRGVDAELGGDLHVTGTTTKPVPKGAFALQHGTIAALGKTLTFSKGNLAFDGDLMPTVDFAAQIESTDITAQVAVTGPATSPHFAFTSSPELPQDEILSRVLFQKPSGNLSGFQALQLAQAAAQFSGDGDGVYERMRKSLGVGAASDDGRNDGPLTKLSRALGDRVSVGVVTGATAAETGISADVDVTKHIRVQSDVRSSGATSVGVGSEIEY